MPRASPLCHDLNEFITVIGKVHVFILRQTELGLIPCQQTHAVQIIENCANLQSSDSSML